MKKRCPKCGVTGRVAEVFGFRKVRGVKRPQSWCADCRKGKKGYMAGIVPDLTSYDIIVVSSSGGKDSQAMLDYVTRLATKAGVKDRVVVCHADLGKVEWEGTGELAERQAASYGLPFIVTTRLGGISKVNGKVYSKGEVFGDLLDYAERRGAWPDAANRWCTSEFKRGPIMKVYTKLAAEWRAVNEKPGYQVRILDCMGLRAEESPARKKKVQFENRSRVSNSRKYVDAWLPIQHWTVGEVWETIRKSGVEHHRAYDLGMPRLSCAFCIFAPKAALVLAGKHNKELLREYVRVEKVTGHKFRMNLALADVLAAVEADETVDVDSMDSRWNM